MDDVKVNYNSSKPDKFGALAYTQGTDIHVGSGQEKHLPHEVWHVVQQKQGRVRPTMQMKGKMNVNDNDGLEKEADIMGANALHMNSSDKKQPQRKSVQVQRQLAVVQLKLLDNYRLNVVGENHNTSDAKGRRSHEKNYSKQYSGSKNYWREYEYRKGEAMYSHNFRDKRPTADPFMLRFEHSQKLAEQHAQDILKFLNNLYAIKTNDQDEIKAILKTLSIAFNILQLEKIQIKNLRINLNRLKGEWAWIQTTGFELDENEKTKMLSFGPDVDNLTITLDSVLEMFNHISVTVKNLKNHHSTYDGIILKELIAVLKDHIKIMVGLEKKNPLGDSSSDNLRDARSVTMHLVANNQFKELGVWKIGNKHVKDIKNHKNLIPMYNLVTNKDFDTAIDTYSELYNDDIIAYTFGSFHKGNEDGEEKSK
jgi:hypothetical protein